MTNGPQPPHERSWRHPSELAAPVAEPTTPAGRVLIISTATVGLVLVGVLALLMTPDRVDQAGDAVVSSSLALVDAVAGSTRVDATPREPPGGANATPGAGAPGAISIALTTTVRPDNSMAPSTFFAPSIDGPTVAGTSLASISVTVVTTVALTAMAPLAVGANSSGDTRTNRTDGAPRTIGGPSTGPAAATSADIANGADIGRASTAEPPPSRPDLTAATQARGMPIVTPIGPDGLAITTRAACDCDTGDMSAILPTGSVVDVHVVDSHGQFVVVALPMDGSIPAMAIADGNVGPTEAMAVMNGGSYTAIDASTTSALCVPEGAPVIDDHGMLVGLCTNRSGAGSIVAVDSVPVPIPPVSEPVPVDSVGVVDSVVDSSPVGEPTTSSTTTTMSSVATSVATTSVATTTITITALEPTTTSA